MRSALTFALLCFAALAARAEEFSILGGITRWDEPRRNTYGWQISYTHELGDYFAGSLTYRNEGHVPGHHRDGQAAQLWARAPLFSPNLTLALGAGPYFYFDTTVAEGGAGYADAHGYGRLYSATATWGRPSSAWYYQLRADRVATKRNLDTTTLLVGVGRRLDQDGSFASNSDWEDRRDTRNELVVSTGKTIVNSLESQVASARGVEFRHAFTPVLRGSLGWINEGDARLIRRNGVVVQGWLEPSLHDDRYTLGFGVGGYFAIDEYQSKKRINSGIVTMTAGFHFSRHWLARFSWHRITSTYDRDSDILLAGLGYRF